MNQPDHLDLSLPREISAAVSPGKEPAPSNARERIAHIERESLSANFNCEIDAWARHAQSANGFGDCW